LIVWSGSTRPFGLADALGTGTVYGGVVSQSFLR
jgi:hypothetical protein